MMNQKQGTPQKDKNKPGDKRQVLWACLSLLVISCCGLTLLGGAGYYLYNTGVISRRSVQNALGLGYGEIQVINITDSRINTYLTRLDTESGDPELFNDMRIVPTDIAVFGGIPPGRYLLELNGAPSEGTCRMEIENDDFYQIVVVPEGTAITRTGFTPSSADEVDMATTSLCKK